MKAQSSIKKLSKHDLEYYGWDKQDQQEFKLTLNTEEMKDEGIELCIFKPSVDIYGDTPESLVRIDFKELEKLKEFLNEACKMLDSNK